MEAAAAAAKAREEVCWGFWYWGVRGVDVVVDAVLGRRGCGEAVEEK